VVSFPRVSPPRPYTHPSPRRSFLILSTHVRLDLPIGLFPPGFPTKKPIHPPHHTGTKLILYKHLRLGLPSGLFPSGFPTKTLYTNFFPQMLPNINHSSTHKSPQRSLSTRFPHIEPIQPLSPLIELNIIRPSTPSSPHWSLSLWLQHQVPIQHFHPADPS